jgi:antitoxin (DNA-binding transcriptional repressor) of toxin-antitoxin stability system
MLHVDLIQAQVILPQLLDAALKGEEVVITREEHPVAKLIAFTPDPDDLRLGSAQGLVTLRDDFDEPLEDFEGYR